MTPAESGAHAKPGDIQVGTLRKPIGMWRDEVYLRDLSPEAQRLLNEAMAWVDRNEETLNYLDAEVDGIFQAARIFTRSVRM